MGASEAKQWEPENRRVQLAMFPQWAPANLRLQLAMLQAVGAPDPQIAAHHFIAHADKQWEPENLRVQLAVPDGGA